MSQEKFNVLINSNHRLKTLQFSLSKTWFYLIAALSSVILFIFAFIVIDYANLVIKDTKYSYLVEQNEELKSKIKTFSEKMEVIQVDLEKVNRFSRKLKMIAAGENESEKQLELSLGKPLMEAEPEEKRTDQASEYLGNLEEGVDSSFPLFRKNKSEYAFANPVAEADLTFLFEKTNKQTKLVERELTLLFEKVASQRDLLQATPSIRPAGGGWVSSGFGYRTDPFTGRRRLHKGLDFAAMIGTPIYAPADGVVSYSGRHGGYGLFVSIDHGYGIVTRFAHNSRLLVKRGEKVKRWQKIAESGSTGRSSGPHLHYEVRVNGVPVNPENYILTN